MCGKAAASDRAENPYAPFCSQRCRTIDLGRWLAERYRISSPLPRETDES
ncbi:MAG TPA: DNA gyrase inhibitor YacG [Planctomycetaceae bacterium]|nr:DNA gyrase inhibitor YacG [Planctomycetaceae bacterium]